MDAAVAPWVSGPALIRPQRATIDVWRAELCCVPESMASVLSPEEHMRAAAIISRPRSLMWSSARAVLRDLLGRYLERDPAALRLEQRNGCPRLAAKASRSTRLSFGISHSRGMALLAVTASCPVAVDIERGWSAARDEVRLARRAFGASVAADLGQLPPPDRRRAFLRMWTRHEALTKLSGLGIWGHVASAGSNGWVEDVPATEPATAAAIAAAVPPQHVRYWEWSPSC